MLVIPIGLMTLVTRSTPPCGPRAWAGVRGDSRRALRACPPEQSRSQPAHSICPHRPAHFL